MPWTLIFDVLLKLLDWFLTWRKADDKAKEEFLKFVESMAHYQLISVNLMKESRDQCEALKKMRQEYLEKKDV